MIDEFITDKLVEINKDVNTQVDLVFKALEKLREVMSFENNGTTSRLVEFFRFCEGVNTSVGSSTASTLEPSQTTLLSSPTPSVAYFNQKELLSTDVDVQFSTAADLFTIMEGTTEITETSIQQKDKNYEQPWLNITSLDKCKKAHRKFKNYIEDVILIPYGHVKGEQAFFVMAEKYNHSVNGSGPLKYPECFDLIEKGKAIMDFFNDLVHLASQLVEIDVGESLNIIEELMERLEGFKVTESIQYFDTRLNQTCGWRKDFSETVREKAEMYKEYITYGRLSLLQLETPLLRYYAIVMIWNWDSELEVDKYLTENITKHELAEQSISESYVARRGSSSSFIEELEDLMKQYLDQVFLSLDFLKAGYFSLTLELPVVIINKTSIERLHLVQKAMTVESLDYFARRGDLWNTIYHIAYEMQSGPIKEMNNNVTKPLREREEQLKIVETTLKEYLDSIRMHSHFYL